ncbi:MAG: hypothetical protein IKB93_03225 [Clostridia bacterium]|nr:hypothetical protein [Clostridia bacterium]
MKLIAWKNKLVQNFKRVIKNNDGDQITGWLIVVLMVVVVGAFFLSTYQDTITEIWGAIVDKIYDTFGL